MPTSGTADTYDDSTVLANIIRVYYEPSGAPMYSLFQQRGMSLMSCADGAYGIGAYAADNRSTPINNGGSRAGGWLGLDSTNTMCWVYAGDQAFSTYASGCPPMTNQLVAVPLRYHRRMRQGWMMLALIVPACNQVFGLDPTEVLDADTRADLDHDGIADEVDPCLAGQADGDEDYDSDAIANRDDGCPTLSPNGTDGDGDGVPDACDPFSTLVGDRHRCTMRFLSADLDASLWHARTGASPWLLSTPGGLISNREASSIVADETIEAPATTAFEVHARISVDPNMPTELGFWLRAADAPSPADVGCVLVSTGSLSYHLELRGAGVNVASSSSVLSNLFDGVAQVTAVLEPRGSGSNVRCYAVVTWFNTVEDVSGSFGVLAATVALPPGHVAFSNVNMAVDVDVLTVYDRDDAPPLP